MKYPRKEIYEILYKRFFVRPLKELIDMAGPVNIGKGKNVLDLCCGTGRLSQELTRLGCFVTGVDESEQMYTDHYVDNILGKGAPFCFKQMSVEHFLLGMSWKDEKELYDAVFCQQAINYWFNNIKVECLANIMKKNGRFVFNTFKNKPGTEPTVKTYKLNEKAYVEVYYAIDNIVHHMQSCEGVPMHITSFEYIPTEDFKKRLSPFFDVDIIEAGNTHIYKCIKKCGAPER